VIELSNGPLNHDDSLDKVDPTCEPHLRKIEIFLDLFVRGNDDISFEAMAHLEKLVWEQTDVWTDPEHVEYVYEDKSALGTIVIGYSNPKKNIYIDRHIEYRRDDTELDNEAF